MIEPLQDDSIYNAVLQANLERQENKRCTYFKANLFAVPKLSGRSGNKKSGYTYISINEFNQAELMKVRHILRTISNVTAVIIKLLDSFPKSFYECGPNEPGGFDNTGKFSINDKDMLTIRRVHELLTCPTRKILLVDRREDITPSYIIRNIGVPVVNVGSEFTLYTREKPKCIKAALVGSPIYVNRTFHRRSDDFTKMKILFPSIVATAVSEVHCVTMADGSSFFIPPSAHRPFFSGSAEIFEKMAKKLIMDDECFGTFE